MPFFSWSPCSQGPCQMALWRPASYVICFTRIAQGWLGESRRSATSCITGLQFLGRRDSTRFVPMAYGNLALDLILNKVHGRLVVLKNGRYDNMPIDNHLRRGVLPGNGLSVPRLRRHLPPQSRRHLHRLVCTEQRPNRCGYRSAGQRTATFGAGCPDCHSRRFATPCDCGCRAGTGLSDDCNGTNGHGSPHCLCRGKADFTNCTAASGSATSTISSLYRSSFNSMTTVLSGL